MTTVKVQYDPEGWYVHVERDGETYYYGFGRGWEGVEAIRQCWLFSYRMLHNPESLSFTQNAS